MSAGIMAFSTAVNSGKRWWLWKMKPTVSLRKRARPASSRSKMGSPAKRTSPRVGTSSAPMTLRKVLLPEPDAPVSATISPGASSRSMPRSTSTRRGAPPAFSGAMR